MKKNGFTLVELLAVIAILSVVVAIATTSVIAVRNSSFERLLENKKKDLEKVAILYGQDHQDMLTESCNIDDVSYSFCKDINVSELLDNDYYESKEVITSEGKQDLLNDVTKESMREDIITIYRKNNRIYAKYIGK